MWQELLHRLPASLMTVSLLNRPEARAPGITFEPQVVGFEITNPDVWAIGFGLDLDEAYREEPYIYGKVTDGRPLPAYTMPVFPPDPSWLTRAT